MPDLLYRGAIIPGVPQGAMVVEARGYAQSGGPGSSGLFTFDDSTAVAGNHLFRPIDLADFPLAPESGRRVLGRLIGVGTGLRVYSTANVWWYAECRAGVQLCELDATGALVAGTERNVLQALQPAPITPGAFRPVRQPIIDGALEVVPLLAPYHENILAIDDRTGVRASWQDNGLTFKAPASHRFEVVVAVALWLEPDGGPRPGLEFPPIAEEV